MSSSSFAEKYPLTEKDYPLQKGKMKRWQYTLSGWIRLIKTPSTEEGKELERQILDRMWEDQNYDRKIRDEFDKWLSEGEKWEDEELTCEESEDKIRKLKRKTIRNQGKYKSRGKEKRREP